MVTTNPCGVHDLGRLLAEELRQRGMPVREEWIANDGYRLSQAFPASLRLLAAAGRMPRGCRVLWHYASFAHAVRGLPLFGVLFGLCCRLRGIRVVTFLHEPAASWRRAGWRRFLQAAAQHLALPLVLRGSSAVVVTTDQRAQGLRRRGYRNVTMVPVFSNIAVSASSDQKRNDGRFTVGLFGYGGDGFRPDLLPRALATLADGSPFRVLVLGGPGLDTHPGRRLMEEAELAGVASAMEFTGVLPEEELSKRLLECDVVALMNEEGASSRKGTLAAALLHGRAILTLDGPARWEKLVCSGAVHLADPSVEEVATALRELQRSPELRAELEGKAHQFYQDHMRMERAGAIIRTLLEP